MGRAGGGVKGEGVKGEGGVLELDEDGCERIYTDMVMGRSTMMEWVRIRYA